MLKGKRPAPPLDPEAYSFQGPQIQSKNNASNKGKRQGMSKLYPLDGNRVNLICSESQLPSLIQTLA